MTYDEAITWIIAEHKAGRSVRAARMPDVGTRSLEVWLVSHSLSNGGNIVMVLGSTSRDEINTMYDALNDYIQAMIKRTVRA